MTAFQSMMFSALGEALTPCGGSCCSRLKSRIRRCARPSKIVQHAQKSRAVHRDILSKLIMQQAQQKSR